MVKIMIATKKMGPRDKIVFDDAKKRDCIINNQSI